MRARRITALMLAFAGLTAVANAQGQRAAEVLERFANANQWRDHVMVVAHRGGGRMKGGSLYPENSVAAVEASIALGVEMVELDVQETRDGEFVVLHDSWLDRTTSCKDRSSRKPAALSGSAEWPRSIPTLRRDGGHTGPMFNVDNKLDIDSLPAWSRSPGPRHGARGRGRADSGMPNSPVVAPFTAQGMVAIAQAPVFCCSPNRR